MTPAPFHIDTKAFERSFFYIGPGFDIQPLLRFTHVCDTFLYANVFLDTRPAEEWYDHALAESPDIEIVGKDVEMGFALDSAFELGPEPWTNVNAAGFMSHMEIMDYFETFRRIHDLEQFSITWQLKRRSTGRRLTLRYFTSAGALYDPDRRSRVSPRDVGSLLPRSFQGPAALVGEGHSARRTATLPERPSRCPRISGRVSGARDVVQPPLVVRRFL
jgi:hypothetical protein